MPDDNLVQSGYDAVYEALPASETFRRIWSEHACGTDYPSDDDHISFVTLPEMNRVRECLKLPPGATLVDLACGAGGPGLWLAGQARLVLVGVDLSTVGLSRARERSERLRMAGTATFVEGSFAATGLEAGVADGAVSFDAIQYAPDKLAAFDEAARLLRPGGRFVFTAFEVEPDRIGDLPVLGDDPIEDYRPLLERAGFAVEHYEETPGWRERVRSAYQAVVDEHEALSEEMGTPAYFALAGEAALTLDRDFYLRRVLAATRRG